VSMAVTRVEHRRTEVRPLESLQGDPRPSPRENFFGFVNHDWLQKTEIPADQARWGTFNILIEKTTNQLNSISLDTQRETVAKKGSHTQLIRDFYTSAMDTDIRNRRGTEPMRGFFSDIDRSADPKSISETIAKLHLAIANPFFGFYVSPDLKAPEINALTIWQGGITMPERTYYIDDNEEARKTKNEFKKYINNIFKLSGSDTKSAENAADTVLRIEQSLAEASLPKAELRDKEKNYNKFTLEEAKTAFPGIDWDIYFGTLGIPDVGSIVIGQPGFMKKVSEIVQSEDPRDLQTYMKFKVLNESANTLTEDFGKERFNFFGKTIQGLEEQKPLWKRTIDRMGDTLLTDALGPLYVERHFNSNDKARIMEMVGNITQSFKERIIGLDWMDEATKPLALEKTDRVTYKMGFPDKWVDISGVEINSDTYAENNFNLNRFEANRDLQKVNKPVDKTEWGMPAIMVNASARQTTLEMTFPAAILQSPFYDSAADEAYNYGAIGYVIGHELSHFADDQGSKFDVNGKLNNWWPEKVKTAFAEGTTKFIEYYNKFSSSGHHVKGEQTLGENIADVAGLAIAFDAFQHHLQNGGDNSFKDGLTPEQRFFVGFGRVWKQKIRQEEAIRRSITDVHAPDDVRVNAVAALNPDFHRAFGVKPGDEMYTAPEDRPKLW